MEIDEFLGERQAQSGAAMGVRRHGIADLAVDLKQLRQVRAGDADTGVGHADDDAAVRRGLEVDDDPAVLGRELHGVRHHVGNDLPDLPLAGTDHASGDGRVVFDIDRPGRDLRRHHVEDIADQRGHVELRLVEFILAGLGLRQVEHVVDERQQVLAGLADAPGIVGVFFMPDRAEHLPFDHLRKAQYRIERGTQFVAHIREELRLGLVRAFGFLLRGDNTLLVALAFGHVAQHEDDALCALPDIADPARFANESGAVKPEPVAGDDSGRVGFLMRCHP